MLRDSTQCRQTRTMKDPGLTRRGFVKQSLAAVTLPLPANTAGPENTDILFTHWPVDTHMDHQVASMLTIRSWMSLNTPSLYFFEVDLGSQTEGFLPNTYVDISTVVDQKKAALFAHVSQDGRGIWREHHEIMAQWRGREIGVAAAEAFIHLNRDHQGGDLPGL